MNIKNIFVLLKFFSVVVDKKYMKVSNYDIFITSSSYKITKYERKESFRYWIGDRTSNSENTLQNSANKIFNIDKLEYKVNLSPKECKGCQQLLPKDNLNSNDRLKILIIEELVYVLTGKRIKIKVFDISQNIETPEIKIDGKNIVNTNIPSWGLLYDSYESYSEKQNVTLNVTGSVITIDGREFNLDLQFKLSREFFIEKNIQIREGDAKRLVDPLVINFNEGIIEFSDKKIDFDLNGDGIKEKIPFVNSNSGFLAYDINNDGQINDGMELFGPKTGNGFRELSMYDNDKNGWIDENDTIFNDLKVWAKKRDGKDILYNLKDLNIGAIYLSNLSIEFDMNNDTNETLGIAKKVGIFLKENGKTNTIMHIDIKI